MAGRPDAALAESEPNFVATWHNFHIMLVSSLRRGGKAMKKMFAATLSALAISWLSASTALANPVVLNPDFASPSYAVGSQGWAYLGPAAPATATVND